MKVVYFTRKFNNTQGNSIEKLFDIIINEIKKHCNVKNNTNPYGLGLIQMFKTCLYFRKEQGDINHITGDIHWSCLFLDRNKTILTIHDAVGIRQYSGIRRIIYYIIWILLPLIKLKYIVCISDKTRDEIIKLYPPAKKKIRVIHNCLTTEISNSRMNEEYYCTGQVLKVLIVGTRENKNIERSILALQDLPLELYIVGFLRDADRELLKSLNINFKNYFNISEKELINLYKLSHVLLFPSLYEGFGLPVLEAQANNCAVITSNISPMNTICGKGAILVDPYDVSSIKEAINDILINEEVYRKLIDYGRLNVINYTPEKIANEYLNLYNQVINNK
ncbi:glycosyltransferase family 4 protein [Elizabethkingia anophelis]|uniref:glycosyltransferase family 4 protein n=1 Tax=Elizabethkingia anophelis TaxID=1117645 RepID=UPI002013988D|nr:glycosyltransferase family 1 protein [Elizabethkingia anophelis]EJC8061656.1 glycosyltransferase family 4 protein [Elizabethkingia anophelis]MCL1642579.1 glycosyltransferase family 4 protein [Elizabethkingia anophelis]MCL1645828.1 glycosyltransferase family 4 protein [Elizabethkingia anophelis]MCT3927190.1 glycosyltransferase family 4 protein [Elizabethkingia anophelis]MCT4034789.1 glycosyltransferase family 4 protein [Elizabethkingia anophelis]